MSKIKRILVKSLLCLSFIIGITLFASDEAYAWGQCTDCTCAPGAPGRNIYSGDIDFRGNCDSFSEPCEIECGGHRYDEGPGTWNDIPTFIGWYCWMNEWDEWKSNGCFVWCVHHIDLARHCSWCQQDVWTHGESVTYQGYWHDITSADADEWYRHPWDPCQVWNKHTHLEYCKNCGTWTSGYENHTFLWWSHNNGLHWAETGIKGDRSYHALWCNAHGWVNAENCENPPPQYGQYAGTWDNLLTPIITNDQRHDGILKYYTHNLSSTNYGDSMHYKCTDCGHTHSLGCTLTSTRADNNTFIGKSNISTAFIPGANDAWTNTDVKLTASQGNSIINKNTSAWLGSPQTITQEGTNIFYTYMSGHGNAVTSKEHYVKIDKTAPKLTGTSVKAGTYQAPATTSTAHDSESYGLKVTLKADDSNANARGGANDVAKIKEAYVIVRDKDNANNSKRYNIDGVTDKVSINTSKVIDVNKDFHGVLDFEYEIHVIDYAGNDAVKKDKIIRNPEVFLSVKNVTQNIQLNGSNVFLGGEHGILTITTTGYCDISNLKWNE